MAKTTGSDLAGEYMVARVGDELVGLRFDAVKVIAGKLKLVDVLEDPALHCYCWVGERRDLRIPVIDLGSALWPGSGVVSLDPVVIVATICCDSAQLAVGIAVDAVVDNVNFSASDSVTKQENERTPWLAGTADAIGAHGIQLLALDKVIASGDFKILASQRPF